MRGLRCQGIDSEGLGCEEVDDNRETSSQAEMLGTSPDRFPQPVCSPRDSNLPVCLEWVRDDNEAQLYLRGRQRFASKLWMTGEAQVDAQADARTRVTPEVRSSYYQNAII